MFNSCRKTVIKTMMIHIVIRYKDQETPSNQDIINSRVILCRVSFNLLIYSQMIVSQ